MLGTKCTFVGPFAFYVENQSCFHHSELCQVCLILHSGFSNHHLRLHDCYELTEESGL